MQVFPGRVLRGPDSTRTLIFFWIPDTRPVLDCSYRSTPNADASPHMMMQFIYIPVMLNKIV